MIVVGETFASDQSRRMIISPLGTSAMSGESASLHEAGDFRADARLRLDRHDVMRRAAGALGDEVRDLLGLIVPAAALAVRDDRDAAEKTTGFEWFEVSHNGWKRYERRATRGGPRPSPIFTGSRASRQEQLRPRRRRWRTTVSQ